MECITLSYLCVHGTPGIFGDCQMVHKEYCVPGPLSLAHMDGQHGEYIALADHCFLLTYAFDTGLIHYKMVIHCIINSFSRFVFGI
jgi:hypothetical protein